jgi:hypothetical protein
MSFLLYGLSKVRHRRTTGSRTWKRYIILYYVNFVFVENITSEEDLHKIQNVSYSAFKNDAKKVGVNMYLNTRNKEDLKRILKHI